MKLQRGYSLLEVIVAFAVLALALTLLLGSLSGASRQIKQADLRSRAVLHAQSLVGGATGNLQGAIGVGPGGRFCALTLRQSRAPPE